MSHPPYSPDLALNDFFLFPYVKNKMSGQRFSTPAFGDTSIRVAKVHASNACKIKQRGTFWKTIKTFSMINICFCSLIPKYKRQPSYSLYNRLNTNNLDFNSFSVTRFYSFIHSFIQSPIDSEAGSSQSLIGLCDDCSQLYRTIWFSILFR